ARPGPRHRHLAADRHHHNVDSEDCDRDGYPNPDVTAGPAKAKTAHGPLLDEPHPRPQHQPDTSEGCQ
ncbi:hypothetical protein P9486_26925, partial [Escherichia coli]|uniref:hypothetical protein n=1 Tax=Escherichia coli TaxID=562 RepID=UPI00398B7EA7